MDKRNKVGEQVAERRETGVVALGFLVGTPLAFFGMLRPGSPTWALLILGLGLGIILLAGVLHTRPSQR